MWLDMVVVCICLVCVGSTACDMAFAMAPGYVQQHLHKGVESDFYSAEYEVYFAARAH